MTTDVYTMDPKDTEAGLCLKARVPCTVGDIMKMMGLSDIIDNTFHISTEELSISMTSPPRNERLGKGQDDLPNATQRLPNAT